MERLIDQLRSGEKTTQLVALQELCEVLSLATENLLQSLSPRELSRCVVAILNEKNTSTPDIKLMAIRCLNNLMAALPGGPSLVATAGAIPPLCASVRTISYIDVAEEALMALGRITKASPSAVLREGGLSAILTNLAFFAIRVQRMAMETAALLVSRVTPLNARLVILSLSKITDLLEPTGDEKVQNTTVRLLTSAIKSLARNKSFRKAILCGASQRNGTLTRLLAVAAHHCKPGGKARIPGSPEEVSTREIFHALSLLCEQSPEVSIAIMHIQIPGYNDNKKSNCPPIGLLISSLLAPSDGKILPLSQPFTFDAVSLAAEMCPPISRSGKASSVGGTVMRRRKRKNEDVKIFRACASKKLRKSQPLKGEAAMIAIAEAEADANLNEKVIMNLPKRSHHSIDATEERMLRQLSGVLIPVFIHICQQNGRVSVQQLCVRGVTRLLPYLLASCSSDPDSKWSIFDGICPFLIQLMRSSEDSLNLNAFKIAGKLLESKSSASFKSQFLKEGVFASASHLVGFKRSKSSSVRSSSARKDMRHSSYFDFFDGFIVRSKAVKVVARNFMQRGLGKDIAKALKDGHESLQALCVLKSLSVELNDLVARGYKTLDSLTSESYSSDRKILRRIDEAMSRPGYLSSFEILSSGIISSLCAYLCVERPEIPSCFNALSKASKSSSYIKDATLLFRRVAALESFFIGKGEKDSKSGIISALINALEAAESFRVRLDLKAAMDPLQAINYFTRPLKLKITEDKNSHQSQSSSSRRRRNDSFRRRKSSGTTIPGVFAVDPLTTIGSIGAFLIREHPHILKPSSVKIKGFFKDTSKSVIRKSRKSDPYLYAQDQSANSISCLSVTSPLRKRSRRLKNTEASRNAIVHSSSQGPVTRSGISFRSSQAFEIQLLDEQKKVKANNDTAHKESPEISVADAKKARDFAMGKQLQISINGHQLPPWMSVFEAVTSYGIKSASSSVTSDVELVNIHRAWDEVFHLQFNVVRKAGDMKTADNNTTRFENIKLEARPLIQDILKLLKTLNNMCESSDEYLQHQNYMKAAESALGFSNNDSKADIITSSEQVNSSSICISTMSPKLNEKMMRQLCDPLIVCSTTGFTSTVSPAVESILGASGAKSIPIGKSGIPAWSHWIAQNTPFLLSPNARSLYFKMTGFSAPQHLQLLHSHLKGRKGGLETADSPGGRSSHPRSPFRGTPGVPLEYRVKHVKVFTRRANTLEAACQLLDHHASDRCSIRAEFLGEKGVGLGPTVEFYALASREFQKKNLGLWRDEDEDEAKDTKEEKKQLIVQKKGRSKKRKNVGVENSQSSTSGNVNALYFVVRRCTGCHLVSIPKCKKHHSLLTEIEPDGKWKCPITGCNTSTRMELKGLKTENVGRKKRARESSPSSGDDDLGDAEFCTVCGSRTELMEWGLTRNECDYLIQSYPRGVEAFPHLLLKCNSCGCINFPGNRGRLHLNCGGRMLSEDGVLVSEVQYRNVFGHSLRCCVGSALQSVSVILQKSTISDLKSLFPTSILVNSSEAEIKSLSEDAEHVNAKQGLFPRSIDPKNPFPLRFASKKRRQQLHKNDSSLRAPLSLYENVGRLIAQAIFEGRILDADFSPAFLCALTDGEMSEKYLEYVDSSLAKSLKKLKVVARKYRHYKEILDLRRSRAKDGKKGEPVAIESKKHGDEEKNSSKMEDLEIFKVDGCPVEELCLHFTVPGMDVELIDNGSKIPVTLANVDLYIRKVYRFILKESVSLQIGVIKRGFNQICSSRALKTLSSKDQAEIIFGDKGRSWDFSVSTLMKYVKCSQGYSLESQAIRFLFQILSQMDGKCQRKFIRFLTGCPRLPAGQLSSLRPPVTIVRVPWSQNNPNALPLASTCTNYLKLPDYPAMELMRERINYSIHECPHGFQLS
mmetsp:Transcript_18004/g.26978  ORF Transcript_18004/g.26978 Transcript_18004/m.26978 type:complete len:1896 (+) Transcript_18004:97-5784(+)